MIRVLLIGLLVGAACGGWSAAAGPDSGGRRTAAKASVPVTWTTAPRPVAATESMAPDAIDRLILLAPSVSTGYDVCPALTAAREGVDVFCSKKDWVALGFVVRVVGTTDRFWSGSAAGRYGFQARAAPAEA